MHSIDTLNSIDGEYEKPKIFISWSGARSREAARVLKEWLRGVMQAFDPWMSDSDIPQGTNWNQTLTETLNHCALGIFCVTRENYLGPWLNYEAGFLARSFGGDSRRVIPLLLGVSSAVIPGTLSQFQYSAFTKEKVFEMVQSINTFQGLAVIDNERLRSAFEMSWNGVEEKINSIIESADYDPVDSDDDIDIASAVTEILDQIRTLSRTIGERHTDAAVDDNTAWAGIPVYEVGDNVHHETYGYGTVQQVWKEEYDEFQHMIVMFEEERRMQFNTRIVGDALGFGSPPLSLDDVPF